jgi:hypothetical protein
MPMSSEIKKVFVETVVCAGAPGKEARFMRMLESRQTYKRRQDGCLAAWTGTSIDGAGMVLVQSVFVDNNAWKRISDEVMKALDTKDGGMESVLAGPPLVGMFEIDPEKLRLPQ